MLFELRQYRTFPGQRENWVRFMEEQVIPFQTAKGMVIVGSWVGEQDADVYVWLRRFESEAERERLYREVYQSDDWKERFSPRIREMLDREQIVVTRLTPTPRSVIR
jgi:hypothetical protein